ncbi:MAG: hypothetical protein AAGF12_27325 [Myxococcota bacterium]
MGPFGLGALALIAILFPGTTLAQPAIVTEAPSVESTPTLTHLTLRPTESAAQVAVQAAEMLRWRSDVEVTIGDAPPPDVLEAVPENHLAMEVRDEQLRLVLAGPHGHTYDIDLEAPRGRVSEAEARAVALAVESLVDEARATPPPAPRDETSSSYRVEVDEEARQRALDNRRWANEAIAKPTIYFRLLFGYSPTRDQVLIGPGAGFGLCVGQNCVVVEADLPILSDEVEHNTGRITYRPVNLAVRAQLRPFDTAPFVPALNVGLLTRIGNAENRDTRDNQIVSSLGARAGLEVAWNSLSPFEVVAEAGVDVAFSRALFVQDNSVFLEDVWTPWFVLSIRLRPGA